MRTTEDIASAIVHEATHARLWRYGFRYPEEMRSRIEAVCFRRERAFATKLPNGEKIQDLAARSLAAYAGQEHWTDEVRRQRQEEGVIRALEYLGVPKWLMRALRATRRWRLGSPQQEKSKQA